MIATLIDKNDKQDKQDEKFIELSSKLSTYEDRLEKMSINKKQLQNLTLQVKENSEELSSMKGYHDERL